MATCGQIMLPQRWRLSRSETLLNSVQLDPGGTKPVPCPLGVAPSNKAAKGHR